MTTDDTRDAPTVDRSGSDRLAVVRRRAVIYMVVVAVTVATWFLGAAALPRWWAQRIGDVVDGRLGFGTLLGLTFGVVFTAGALWVVWLGWRLRGSLRRAALTIVAALLIAAPNLMTLGIVVGDGSAAHAGERILDVDGPGFRGGTLVGAVIGVLAVATFAFLSASRRRNRRRVQDLKAERDTA